MADLVYVVDDDDLLRQLLIGVLSTAGFKATGFASAEEFLDHPICYSPSCILLDVTMDGMSGFELQSQLLQREFVPPIIFLTSSSGLEEAVEAMRSGAYHYLLKPVNFEQLFETVSKAIKHSEEESEFFSFLQKLTKTEKKIARLIRQGLMSKQIADFLGISIRTVEWHRKNIGKKGYLPTANHLSKP